MSEAGNIAWITGAGSGIGKETVLTLARNGYAVIASARREQTLRDLKSEAGEYESNIYALPCDVTDEQQVGTAAEFIQSEFGPVDVLVNNAGTTIFRQFMDTPVAELDRLYGVNLRGAFLCAQAVLPLMIERQRGTIVMVNSIAAETAYRDSSIYAATKAGLKAMTDCMRLELRKKGIRLISIFPGPTHTNIWPEQILEKHADKMMSPVNIANTIRYAIEAPGDVMVEDIYVQPLLGGL